MSSKLTSTRSSCCVKIKTTGVDSYTKSLFLMVEIYAVSRRSTFRIQSVMFWMFRLYQINEYHAHTAKYFLDEAAATIIKSLEYYLISQSRRIIEFEWCNHSDSRKLLRYQIFVIPSTPYIQVNFIHFSRWNVKEVIE